MGAEEFHWGRVSQETFSDIQEQDDFHQWEALIQSWWHWLTNQNLGNHLVLTGTNQYDDKVEPQKWGQNSPRGSS